jgi:predicted transglutaminase-like cysteine proteinase
MSNLSAKAMVGVAIAFIACSPKTPEPGTDRNQANSSTEEKYGHSEAKRKQISEEVFQLWIQAGYKSNKKFPFIVPGEQLDIAKLKQRARKRAELQHSLMEESLNEVAKKYNLSLEQLADIKEEGIDKEWTRYPTHGPIYK